MCKGLTVLSWFLLELFRFRVGVRIRYDKDIFRLIYDWSSLLIVICYYLVQAPLSPVPSPGAQPTVGATSLYGVTQLSSPTHGLASPYTSIPSSVGPSSSNLSEQVFPERPGELECQYYLKTGDCKYGPSCRYHHPRDRTVPRITCLLSPMGLPLRPVCKVVLYYFWWIFIFIF